MVSKVEYVGKMPKTYQVHLIFTDQCNWNALPSASAAADGPEEPSSEGATRLPNDIRLAGPAGARRGSGEIVVPLTRRSRRWDVGDPGDIGGVSAGGLTTADARSRLLGRVTIGDGGEWAGRSEAPPGVCPRKDDGHAE